MDLSPGQQGAADQVRAWIKAGYPDQVFRLFGYAGTGKTTIAQQLVAEVQGGVLFACFTGKAAHVLRTKGCANTFTIHQLIYQPKDKSRAGLKKAQAELEEYLAQCAREFPDHGNGPDPERVARLERYITHEKKELKSPAFELVGDSVVSGQELLVIDEVSMVGERMGVDLRSFGTPILVLGDPAQLPPIRGEGYFTDCEPDVLLDEVHRQAEGSPIIKLATIVRNGGLFPYGDHGGGTTVVRKGTLSIEELVAHDQVLVGRNASRKLLNRQFREHLGHTANGPFPVPGDRLVCLKNNHQNGLLNGSQWYVDDMFQIDDDRLVLRVHDDDGIEIEVEAHAKYFTGKEDEIAPWEHREAESFDYAYALTVHKAQGSQWSRVLVIDEGACFRSSAKRWRYTAVTRAADAVTVVTSDGE